MTATRSGPAAVAEPAPDRSMPDGVAEVVLSAAVVVALFPSLVVPSIAEIGRHLSSTPSAAAWTLTGYLLAASVATPPIHRLIDSRRTAMPSGNRGASTRR